MFSRNVFTRKLEILRDGNGSVEIVSAAWLMDSFMSHNLVDEGLYPANYYVAPATLKDAKVENSQTTLVPEKPAQLDTTVVSSTKVSAPLSARYMLLIEYTDIRY